MKQLIIVLVMLLCMKSAAGVVDRPMVVAGGVYGAADIAVAEKSDGFRAAGGGLYLHHNGWLFLDSEERQTVVELFANRPVAIELGFLPSGKAWGAGYALQYKPYNLTPDFIAVNAFANGNCPTLEAWTNYCSSMYRAGVPETTRFFPTFEYANYEPRKDKLPANMVSDRPDFQQLIAEAGGIVLDTPCGYFLSREQNYRDWVIDSIGWSRAHGYTVAVIVSPHQSGEDFPDHIDEFTAYLGRRDCLPDIWICENYSTSTNTAYPNRVGSEDNPVHILGAALELLSGF